MRTVWISDMDRYWHEEGAHVCGWQVALSLSNLAALLVKVDKLSRAEELYRKALTIREESLGPDHPLVGLPCLICPLASSSPNFIGWTPTTLWYGFSCLVCSVAYNSLYFIGWAPNPHW